MANVTGYQDFHQWWDEFKPKKEGVTIDEDTHLEDVTYNFSGKEYVKLMEIHEQSPNNVWTILDCDGVMVVTNGWHYVNRTGYLVTEKPWDEGDNFNVMYDDDIEVAKRVDERGSDYQFTTVVPTPTEEGERPEVKHKGQVHYDWSQASYVITEEDGEDLHFLEYYGEAQDAVNHAWRIGIEITNTEIRSWPFDEE